MASHSQRSKRGRTYIGTSGWNYDHWRGPFYADDTPQKRYFDEYAARLKSVEINNSFYQLPSENTLADWHKRAPTGFVFAVKASRYITHMKKLKDPEEGLTNFLDRATALKGRLGPILFQLPPNWRCNHDRLESFLQTLRRVTPKRRCAVEFRDESWWQDRTYALLEKHGAAFCIYDLERRQSPKTVTAEYVYIRLHGPSKNAYEGAYDRQTLSGWAGAINSWCDDGRDVYCYFDNDQNGHAAINAMELDDMLDKVEEDR